MTLATMTQAAYPSNEQGPDERGSNDPGAEGTVRALDPRRRRILFRATHRGMHEADILLGGYVTPRLAAMTDPDLDDLEEILELVDADLVDWMLGRALVPTHLDTPMLRAVLAAAHQRGTP